MMIMIMIKVIIKGLREQRREVARRGPRDRGFIYIYIYYY